MTDMPPPRQPPIDLSPEEFRRLGHQVVDAVAQHLASLRSGKVTAASTVDDVRSRLPEGDRLPDLGTDPAQLLQEVSTQLFEQSLFNGHPRFFGYITSSASPIGMVGELLAAAVNPNVGAWTLSPVATEIETQTVKWIADLIGFPTTCGGLLVSGGNMANIVCLLAARRAKAPWDVRTAGVAGGGQLLRVYVSTETHTWIQKAADLSGIGTDAICWVPTDGDQRLDLSALRAAIERDRQAGHLPFMIVGTAGSVSAGVVDPLPAIAQVCREHDLWFHVDGAYGAFATETPEAPVDLRGLTVADSVAVDPHKWLYAPLEAGCVLVRRVEDLRNAFSYHPPYYNFDENATNYFDLGPQNSRGFRALKVWLTLRHVGRQGCLDMIADDCRLAAELYQLVSEHPDFEALSQSLSIATFRYVPPDLTSQIGNAKVESYLNRLNHALLIAVEQSGELFLSNLVVGDRYALRACIVNFRTSASDVAAVPPLVSELGRQTDKALRPTDLTTS